MRAKLVTRKAEVPAQRLARLAVAGAALTVCFGPLRIASAASYYWDLNGTAAGLGDPNGTGGHWNTTATNWNSNNTGGTGTISAWSNSTTNYAVFNGTGGQVTIDDSVQLGRVYFYANGYGITGGTITGGGIDFYYTPGVSATVSSTITTTSNMRLYSGGTLTLTSPASIGGGVILYSGANVLKFGVDQAINDTVNYTLYPGSTLDLNGCNATVTGIAMGQDAGDGGTVQTGAGTLTLKAGASISHNATNNSGTASITGKVALLGNTLLKVKDSTATDRELDVSAVISGTGNLSKDGYSGNGNGTVVLSANNTYSGTTAITLGTLLINGTTSGQGNYSFSMNSSYTGNATLGGNGTIGLASTKTLTATGLSAAKLAIVSPGDPGTNNGVDTLTVGTIANGNAVTFANYSQLLIDVSGGSSDILDVKGNLDLSSALDSLVFNIGDTPTLGRYVFAKYTGTLTKGADPLGFNSITYGGLTGATIEYDADKKEIALVIPEPSMAAVLGLGFGAMAMMRRRRCQNANA